MISVNTDSTQRTSATCAADVAALKGAQKISAQAVDTPECSPRQETASSISLNAPAGHVDCRGAQRAVSAFTALITLMCETNREIYASRRDAAKAAMAIRVGELNEAADKTMVAAIVQGALGILGGVASGIGAGVSVSGSGKQLTDIKNFTKPTAADAQMQAGLPPAQPDIVQKNVTSPAQPQQNQPPVQPDAVQKNVAPPAQPQQEQPSAQPDAVQKNVASPAQPQQEQPSAQPVTKQEKNVAQPQQNPLREEAEQVHDNPEPVPRNAAEGFYAKITVESNRISGKTEALRSGSTMFGSLGQTASGSVSATGEKMRAEAEETKNDYDVAMSDMQQFQSLMSQFNQILGSLLEAENKARSAAAQAC